MTLEAARDVARGVGVEQKLRALVEAVGAGNEERRGAVAVFVIDGGVGGQKELRAIVVPVQA